jgi:hypothetical protein
MGYLADNPMALCKGDSERFVFQIETHSGWKKEAGEAATSKYARKAAWKKPTICRDDRDLNQHFLRPAAKALGFYSEGFGFHALRREAVTAISASLGIAAAMRMAGHGDTGSSVLYTLADQAAQEGAVRARQESIIGKAEKVN